MVRGGSLLVSATGPQRLASLKCRAKAGRRHFRAKGDMSQSWGFSMRGRRGCFSATWVKGKRNEPNGCQSSQEIARKLKAVKFLASRPEGLQCVGSCGWVLALEEGRRGSGERAGTKKAEHADE